MAANKLIVLACAIALTGLGAGCMGGGTDTASSSRRTRASRGVFTLGKKKDKAAAQDAQARAPSSSSLDAYTPEGSMGRDLTELRERERKQSRLVAELANTRGADPARFAKEQERLFALRDKIQAYDAALQRYEMASRARPAMDREIPPATVPSEMFQERSVRTASAPGSSGTGYDSYQALRGGDRLDAYGRGGNQPVVYQDDRVTHARVNMSYDQYPEEREQVLYTASGDQNLAGMMYERGGSMPGATAPSPRSPQPAAPARNANQYASGESAAQSRQNRMPWESGDPLFAQSRPSAVRERPAVPNIYAARRQTEETMWPAGTAMVAPAPAPDSPKTTMKTEVRLPASESVRPPAAAAPAAPAPKITASQLKPPAPQPTAGDDDADEIFSPSMFLGAGR